MLGRSFIGARGCGDTGGHGEVAGELSGGREGRRWQWRRRCSSEALLSTGISCLWIGTAGDGHWCGVRCPAADACRRTLRRRCSGRCAGSVAEGVSWTAESRGEDKHGSSGALVRGGTRGGPVSAARRRAADGARGGWRRRVVAGGVQEKVGELGGKGSSGERQTGGDHKVAAPSGAALSMVAMPQGMP